MPGQRGTDVEMFPKEEGVIASAHVNPLVLALHSTCDEGEGLKEMNADR